MQFTLAQLAERAQQLYFDEDSVRERDQLRGEVLNGQHPIAFPPGMENRVYPFRANVLAEKRRLATTLLMSKEGVQFTVKDFGTSAKAEKERSVVEEWTQGMHASMKAAYPELEALIVDNNLTHSRTGLVILPHPWVNMPQLDITELDDLKPDAIEQKAKELEDAQERYKQTTPPLWWKWVHAEKMICRSSIRGGMAECFIYERMSVLDVLETFREPDGTPSAKRLAQAVNARQMSERNTVTVVTRLDRVSYQVAVLDVWLQQRHGERPDLQHEAAGNEMLWEGEHGMGCVPIAIFHGEMWAVDDPAQRYRGFFDSTLAHQVALDNLMTQTFSLVRTAVWPGMVIEKTGDGDPITAPGTGDNPNPISLVEGAINDALGQGERLVPVQWLDAASYQWLREAIQFLMNEIDAKTIPKSAQGGSSADSGYLFAQIQAAAERNLAPWVWGTEYGWARAAQLQLKAAAVLMRNGEDPIPVRFVSEDGVRPVVLTKDLAERDWDIEAKVRVQAIGGEAALVQTLAAAEEAGYIDHFEAMTRFGVRNPLRTMEKILEQKLINSQDVLQMLTQAVMQRTMAQINAALMPNGPAQPLIPDSLAQHLGDVPQLAARLPESGAGQASDLLAGLGIGGQGGLPSVNPPNMAPPVPTISNDEASRRVLRQQGAIPGQAQSLPGGLNRQSDILSRQV